LFASEPFLNGHAWQGVPVLILLVSTIVEFPRKTAWAVNTTIKRQINQMNVFPKRIFMPILLSGHSADGPDWVYIQR
jgi:hypothetical protein